MLRIPGMSALVAMALLGFTSFFLTLSALPLYAVGQGVPEALAGLVTTVMLVATVGCQVLVPAAVRLIGQPATLAVGLFALGAPTPLLLLSDQLGWLLAVSAVRGLGFVPSLFITTLIASLALHGVGAQRRVGRHLVHQVHHRCDRAAARPRLPPPGPCDPARVRHPRRRSHHRLRPPGAVVSGVCCLPQAWRQLRRPAPIRSESQDPLRS